MRWISLLPPRMVKVFSNVIGEAMSCSTMCVVTDVGDSAALVGNIRSSCSAQESTRVDGWLAQIAEIGLLYNEPSLRRMLEEGG